MSKSVPDNARESQTDVAKEGYTGPDRTTTLDRDVVMSDVVPAHETPLVASSQNAFFDVDTSVDLSISSTQPTLRPPEQTSTTATNVFTPNGVLSSPEVMDIDQPPTNATAELPLLSDVAAGRQAGDDHELQTNQAPQEAFDIAKSIKGMYRILDLVSEQGSGGLGELDTFMSLGTRSSI